jgi:hypothetical protein
MNAPLNTMYRAPPHHGGVNNENERFRLGFRPSRSKAKTITNNQHNDTFLFIMLPVHHMNRQMVEWYMRHFAPPQTTRANTTKMNRFVLDRLPSPSKAM